MTVDCPQLLRRNIKAAGMRSPTLGSHGLNSGHRAGLALPPRPDRTGIQRATSDDTMPTGVRRNEDDHVELRQLYEGATDADIARIAGSERGVHTGSIIAVGHGQQNVLSAVPEATDADYDAGGRQQGTQDSLTLSRGTDDSAGSDDRVYLDSASTDQVSRDDQFDIESGVIPPMNKDKLGMTQFQAKTERFALIDAVKTHSLAESVLRALPNEGSAILTGVNQLIASIDGILANARQDVASDGSVSYFDAEDPHHNLTHLASFKETLQANLGVMKADLEDLAAAKKDFMAYKARQANGTTTWTDSAQRNLFSAELHAVFNRSVAQSLLVVGASAGFQAATVSALQQFFTNNPGQIPNPVLEAARASLGSSATSDQVMKAAVANLAAPGSTYLDENTSTTAAIYASEAIVGGFRGVVVPMADSVNESDARAKNVQDAIDKVRNPRPPATMAERAASAMSGAWKAQINANLVSGGIAAAVSTAAAPATVGYKVMIEVGKTLGFSVVSAMNNVGAEGLRAATYKGDSETTKLLIKSSSRILGRGIAQAMKTGVSYAQSAAEGKLSGRTLAADAIKGAMQAGVSGGFKELMGAAFLRVAAAKLPPNEVAVLVAGKAVGSVAAFAAGLDGVSVPRDLDEEGLRSLSDLRFEMQETLRNLLEVNSTEFKSVDFDTLHNNYMLDLRESRNGPAADNAPPGPPQPPRSLSSSVSV